MFMMVDPLCIEMVLHKMLEHKKIVKSQANQHTIQLFQDPLVSFLKSM